MTQLFRLSELPGAASSLAFALALMAKRSSDLTPAFIVLISQRLREHATAVRLPKHDENFENRVHTCLHLFLC